MRFIKAFESFSKFLFSISIFLMSIYTIIAFVNVIARYIFLKPYSWTEEITTLLFVLGVFFIQISLELYDRQLSVSFITAKIKNDTAQRVLYVLKRLVTAGFLFLLVKEAIPVIQRNMAFETATVILKIPMWPLYTAVALVLLIIVFINIGKIFKMFTFKDNVDSTENFQ